MTAFKLLLIAVSVHYDDGRWVRQFHIASLSISLTIKMQQAAFLSVVRCQDAEIEGTPELLV